MPKHRMCKSGGWHFIIGVVAVLAALTVLEPVVYSARPAEAQSGAIKSIRVEGNRRVEPETVRTYLRFNVGDAYDPAKVDQSIKSLFSTGLFSDVRIDREGAGVVVTVVENPVVNQVAFEGNREVDKATLARRGAAQAALRLHPRQGAGRRAAHPRHLPAPGALSPRRSIPRSSSWRTTASMSSSRSTKAARPRFRPSTSSATRRSPIRSCRDIISTSQSGLFDFIKGTNIYDPDRLALDRELLRQYYLKNGYADARVVSAGAELARDGSGFYITFVVDEGELFTFGKVDIESSLAGVDPKALRSELLTVSGATYDQSGDGPDGGAPDAGHLRAGLCLRPRAAARHARAGHAA